VWSHREAIPVEPPSWTSLAAAFYLLVSLVLISASNRSEIKSQGLFILGYRSRHAATREIKAKHTSEEKKEVAWGGQGSKPHGRTKLGPFYPTWARWMHLEICEPCSLTLPFFEYRSCMKVKIPTKGYPAIYN
jgi:hypothetical protein